MKDFFENSINFWIGTRIVIILVILYDLFSSFASPDPQTVFGLASNIYSTFYLVFLSIMLYHELNGTPLPFLLRSLTGGMSLLEAAGITIYILLFFNLLLLIIPVWIFLFGLYDIYNINRYRP
jgi:hypothetical protein